MKEERVIFFPNCQINIPLSVGPHAVPYTFFSVLRSETMVWYPRTCGHPRPQSVGDDN